tara:strand:+ start:79373 stop:80026 length:654 start_codon:yes stop_codon:yes gene_type:complete
MNENSKHNLVLGLDVSTKTIGIALFENLGTSGNLKLLNHVTPIIKPKLSNKAEELFVKARTFDEEFLNKYIGLGITRVIIEEPLLRSNNVNTVGTLLRFNGMISRSVFETLGVVPDFISSYDARKYGFPELMDIRKFNKKGEPYTEKEISKKKATLFGGLAWDIDKKSIVWEKVANLEPQIVWLYTRNKTLKKENYDMTDAYTAVHGYMNKIGEWPK